VLNEAIIFRIKRIRRYLTKLINQKNQLEMKKKLTKFSMALIATTLIFTNVFGIDPPASQRWEHVIQVDTETDIWVTGHIKGEAIGPSTTRNIERCSGDEVLLKVNGTLTDPTLTIVSGNDSVVITLYGDPMLSVIFRVTKDGNLLSEQDYVSLGLPSLGWETDTFSAAMTYPVPPAMNTTFHLDMPNVGDAGTVYRFEILKLISSNSLCAPHIPTAAKKLYTNITVHPMPDVSWDATLSHKLHACMKDTFSFAAQNKMLEITTATGQSFTFDFIGDAASSLPSVLSSSAGGVSIPANPSPAQVAALDSLLLVYYTITHNNTPITGNSIGLPNSPIFVSPLPTLYSLTTKVPVPAIGTYRITIDSMTSFGCKTIFTDIDSTYAELIVHDSLSVLTIHTDHDLLICAGDTISLSVDNKEATMSVGGSGGTNIIFDFTGEDANGYISMHYTMLQYGGTTNTLATTPSLPAPIITVPVVSAPNFPITRNVIVSDTTPGTYRFQIDSLTNSYGCVRKNFQDGYADLIVRPLPTVNFTDTGICQNNALTIEFTGSSTNNFHLNYKYSKLPDPALKDPLPGLPLDFPVSNGHPEGNGVYTYSTTLSPGEPGRFTFYLKSIDDGKCTHINKTSPSWMW
jgi:hypothetical protein